MTTRKFTLTPKEVDKLVEDFENNREAYLKSERHIVRQLINGIGKSRTATLLKVDRKTLYNRYVNETTLSYGKENCNRPS